MRTGGTMVCWGYNDRGQLGNGTDNTTPNYVPTAVKLASGLLLEGVVGLPPTQGSQHSCALVVGGQARCWGYDSPGSLGDGDASLDDQVNPVVVGPVGTPLSDIRALALGGNHSCAVLNSGQARCWGQNNFAQVGDGGGANRTVPEKVLQSAGVPLTAVQAMALGDFHSCVLMTNNTVRCWGRNDHGQLGDGTVDLPGKEGSHLYPTAVLVAPGGAPLGGVQALAVGSSHGCAIVAGGEVRCWGSNTYGQLGDPEVPATPGGVLDKPSAVLVKLASGQPLTGVLGLALGEHHMRCWGLNEYGQLGRDENLGTNKANPAPLPVQGLVP
ncbi:MAG: hypothetical protein MUF34_31765 [Polyangiaceae bacterium]|nr:hypothetical protein [Polyangiaceae bacterium]